MPRPNAPRSIASEQALARRVAHERETRGWTYDGLALRLTKVGCPIHASALYKIEKADPPRRITVDELVAFAQVFAVPVERLLLPPEAAVNEALTDALVEWEVTRNTASSARQAELDAREHLEALLKDQPTARELLEPKLRNWAKHRRDDNPELAVAIEMARLTHDEAWKARVRQLFDEEVQRDGEPE